MKIKITKDIKMQGCESPKVGEVYDAEIKVTPLRKQMGYGIVVGRDPMLVFADECEVVE